MAPPGPEVAQTFIDSSSVSEPSVRRIAGPSAASGFRTSCATAVAGVAAAGIGGAGAGQGVVDDELHDLPRGERVGYVFFTGLAVEPPEGRVGRRVDHPHDGPVGQPREIHDDIGPFGQRHEQGLVGVGRRNGRRHRAVARKLRGEPGADLDDLGEGALLGPDHVEGDLLGRVDPAGRGIDDEEGQVQETGVAAVEQTEPVLRPGHVEFRPAARR